MELLKSGKRFCKDRIWNIFYRLFFPQWLFYVLTLFFWAESETLSTAVHFAQMCWRHWAQILLSVKPLWWVLYLHPLPTTGTKCPTVWVRPCKFFPKKYLNVFTDHSLVSQVTYLEIYASLNITFTTDAKAKYDSSLPHPSFGCGKAAVKELKTLFPLTFLLKKKQM